MDVLQKVLNKFDYAVRLRRYFHENPECGPDEQIETMAYIEKELDKMQIRHIRVENGGIFAFIDGSEEGKTVLLRTDIDALPILENETNLKEKRVCISKRKGVMHACGHDAHIAMLLAEASILNEIKDCIKGHIVLMFEEGEEGYFNIQWLCRAIEKMKLKIDTCYATHVRWDVPAGKIVCCDRTSMSGVYHYNVIIKGNGGHGSRPDLSHSPVDCFNEIYNVLQGLKMKYTAPDSTLTWSVGRIEAGVAYNVIPEKLEFRGTIRYMDIKSGKCFWNEFKNAIESICKLYYCRAEFLNTIILLPVVNYPKCVEVFKRSVNKYLGKDELYKTPPWMASESFSVLTAMYPGVHTFTGIKNDELGCGANHHTPEFDLDEKGMINGIGAAVGYVLEFLNSNTDLSGFTPVAGDMDTLINEVLGMG